MQRTSETGSKDLYTKFYKTNTNEEFTYFLTRKEMRKEAKIILN